jgi:hypothetical protein
LECARLNKTLYGWHSPAMIAGKGAICNRTSKQVWVEGGREEPLTFLICRALFMPATGRTLYKEG